MSESRQSWDRFSFLVPSVISAVIILFWGIYRSPWDAFDDAFITYRYAQNLREGLGLVYNSGEWVLGTTTPFFALLLGGVGLFVEDVALLGHWLAILAWIGVAWGALALLWQADRRWAGVIACLMLAFSPILYASIGMETSLLVALMLWTAWSWGNGRFLLTILLAALLILTRQDSAFWLLLLGLEMWRRTRIFPWREGVGAFLLTLPWLAFAWWRYGSPLPNSAQAKIGQQAIMSVTMPPFYEGLWQTFSQGLPVWTQIILLFSLLLGLWVVATRSRQLWWLPAWVLVYTAVYTLFGVVSFPWYFVPPIVVLVLLTAVGPGSILGDDKWPWLRQVSARWVMGGTAVILTTLLISFQAVTLWQQKDWGSRHHRYHAIGQWFAANTTPDASIATIEIGIVGYHSRRPIVDTMGLISPGMTDHQLGWVETLVYALNTYQPDYALVLPNTAWDALAQRWWFTDNYEPVQQIRGAQIYKRLPRQPAYAPTAPALPLADGLLIGGATFDSQTLVPGQPLSLWVQVSAGQTPERDYDLNGYLIDAATQEFVAAALVQPFDGLYAASKWQPDDQLSLPMQLLIPEDLPDGAYQVGVQFRDLDTGRALALQNQPEVEASPVRLGWLRTQSPPVVSGADLSLTEIELPAWENGIRLTAVSTPATPTPAGQNWPIQFHWHATETVDHNWKLFMHLINDAGDIVAQLDEYPLGGRWPTAVWQANETITDRHTILLPAALAPGAYHLRLGFYDENGRLPLATGDFVIIQRIIEVAPS
jgi:hypothetical protein